MTTSLLAMTLVGWAIVSTHSFAMRQNQFWQKEARDARAILEDAMEAVPGGFVLWDSNDCLAYCNEGFRQLYDRSEAFLVPGTPFADIIRRGAENGQYPQAGDNIDAFVQDIVARHRSGTGIFERLLPDGTWMLVTEKRTAAGAIVGIRTDISALKAALSALEAANGKIAHLARHDALTGLANRLALREHLETRVEALSDGDNAAVLFLDLDRFKHVNDTLVHAAGDSLLAAVGARLRAGVRPSDFVARLGGDEFVVCFCGPDPRIDVGPLAERIIASLGAPYAIGGRSVEVGVSIGGAIGDGKSDAGSLMRRADIALYAAKDAGRQAFCMFTAELEDRFPDRHAVPHR